MQSQKLLLLKFVIVFSKRICAQNFTEYQINQNFLGLCKCDFFGKYLINNKLLGGGHDIEDY